MKKKSNLFLSLGVVMLVVISVATVANTKGMITDTLLSENDDKIKNESVGVNPFEQTFDIEQTSEGLTKIGELDVDFGNAYRVSRESTNLYVSGKTGGVTIIDYSDLDNPQVVGNYYGGGTINDAYYYDYYDDDILVVANSETGVEVLDIRDPDEIEKVAGFYDGGEAYDIEFIGFNTLYVADGSDGLEIFVLDSDYNFTFVTAEKFGTTEILSVRADPLNNIAFLMCGSDGVIVLDISRPTTPLVIDTLKDGSTNSRHADSSALMLYVADGANGLKIYNYTDQNNITLIDQFEVGSGEFCEFFNWDVAKKAYMTTGDYLYQLNTTDPGNVLELWKRSYPRGQTNGILSITSNLFLCNDYDFKVIDLSNKSNPITRAEITFAGEPSSTAISGDTAVLAEGLTGIDIINITDATKPTLISKYENGDIFFIDVDIDGDYVYCATSIGLEIVDISDTNNPTFVANVTSGDATKVVVEGNYAYLSVTIDDLVIIDISDPENPSEVTNVDLNAQPRDINVSGNYVYVAVGNAFQVVDVTTPSSPSIVATESATNADGLDVDGDLLLLADLTDGVRLYNISNLGAIVFLDDVLTTYEATKVAINGNEAFVAVKADGIMEINITDPTNATKEAHFEDGGEALELTVSGDLVFAADTIDSFEIIGEDNDLDTVADYTEINIWGTDPNDEDTDDDGLLDGEEIDYWEDRDIDPLSDFDNDGLTNILDIDSDNDTISDGDEVNLYGSDPIDLDSDDDFIPDEEEVIAGTDTYITDPADDDTDDDGIIDGNETLGYYEPTNPGANGTGWIVGLDPTDPDTDGDGPFDGWEILYGFNPLVADSSGDDDSDGLTTAEEFTYGTDPFDDDTDDDTLTDGDEVNIHGTDPTKEDTDDDFIPDNWEIDNGLDPLDNTDGITDDDSDGLTNYEEYFYDTDPFDDDTDSDGLPDGWEAYFNTDPLTPSSTADPDEDGLTNLEEYNYGTNPTDPDSDDDGFLDSTEIDAGTDPNDPDDFPATIPTTPYSGFELFAILGLFGLGILSLVTIRLIRRRK